MDSHRHASEVSIASNQNSEAEASFDQGSTRTPVSVNGTKHTMAVEHNESLCSLPSGNYQPSDDMSDYVTMAPVKSLSTPLRNGMISSALP